MNVRIIDQGLGTGDCFQQPLLRLFQDTSIIRCTALIAFVTYDGLLRIGIETGGPLHSFVTLKKELHWIVGIEVVTTADALERLRDLEGLSEGRSSIRAFDDPSKGLFHPKVFMFERSDGSGATLIGSNNLTPGGLENNIEASVLIDDISPKEMEVWRKLWQRAISPGHRLYPITDDLISKVRENRQSQRGGRRRKVRVIEEIETEIIQGNPRILLRYIAGAGGRTSQAHFSRQMVEQFFGLTPGDGKTITIQMVQPGQQPGRLETDRPLVFSQTNRNSRIEMVGLKDRLPPNYPAGWYAILLVQEVEHSRYRYMTLIPTDTGYSTVNDYLSQIPQHGKSFQETIILLDRMLEIWPDYPV